MMHAYTNTVSFCFILQPEIVASILTGEECRTLIKEQEATSEVPEEFKDLFPDDDGSQLVDEHGNVIETPPLPPPVILTTDELLTYKREQGYVYQFTGVIFLRNRHIISPITYSDDNKSDAVLFHSYSDFRKCYSNFGVKIDKESFVHTQTYHYDQKTIEAYLQQGTQQLLATYSDDFHQSYLCEDDYYFVVHQKPYRAILFNTFEGFKKYIDFLPYGD